MSTVTYVLIHGAWHGSWCWGKVIPLLKQAGHRVLAPDLPGAGQDQTPLARVTFEGYVNRVLDVLQRETDPVILVGHSMAGMVISQAAEEMREKVRWLTYLTALLPLHGESTKQLQKRLPQQEELLKCLEANEESARLRAEAFRLFYHDCDRADIRLARQHLRPQGLRVTQTPVTLSHHFASVPRVYLSCTKDRVLPSAFQTELFTRTPCEQVLSLPSGHSPFFSMPEQLASCFHGLALVEPWSLTWSAAAV